jgi:uncharacterized membrane protein
MESKKRSIFKSLSWHSVHIVMVSSISFVVTGSIKLAAILVSAEIFFESFLYFTHERIWARVKVK